MFLRETVPKIRTVILSEAKNLMFFFSSQKIKKEILRPYGLKMTRKGKFTEILEHPHIFEMMFQDFCKLAFLKLRFFVGCRMAILTQCLTFHLLHNPQGSDVT